MRKNSLGEGLLFASCSALLGRLMRSIFRGTFTRITLVDLLLYLLTQSHWFSRFNDDQGRWPRRSGMFWRECWKGAWRFRPSPLSKRSGFRKAANRSVIILRSLSLFQCKWKKCSFDIVSRDGFQDWRTVRDSGPRTPLGYFFRRFETRSKQQKWTHKSGDYLRRRAGTRSFLGHGQAPQTVKPPFSTFLFVSDKSIPWDGRGWTRLARQQHEDQAPYLAERFVYDVGPIILCACGREPWYSAAPWPPWLPPRISACGLLLLLFIVSARLIFR